MRRSFVTLLSVKEATEKYLDYLRYSDKELPALPELFPKPGPESHDAVVEFHAQLCETMVRNGYAVKGIQVLSPNHEAARVLRAAAPLCVPLFDNFFPGDTFSTRQFRLQYVEGAISLALGDSVAGDGSPTCSTFSPALVLTGSRFPFYPPTLHGYLCDLCSTVGVVQGSVNGITKENASIMPNYGVVLLKDNEPVETGYGKHFMDDPLKAISLAAAYADRLGIRLTKGHSVVCGGITPRVPCQSGRYNLQWGSFGSTQCSIV